MAGCLEDLESQTIADRMEIVVVDSGSHENERAIVEQFQIQYKNIVYIRTEERETVYASWNRGILATHGKYITNANTDDRHCKDALEKMLNLLEDNPSIVLTYADVHVTEKENETFDHHHRKVTWSWYDWDRNTLLDRGCFIGPQPLWRRSIHETYGYFDDCLTTSGDFEFWLRISQTGDFFHIREPLGLYLQSSSSIEHRSGEIKLQEDINIIQMYRKAADEGKLIKYRPIQNMEKSLRDEASLEILAKTSWWPERNRRRAVKETIDRAWMFQLKKKPDESMQTLFEAIKANPGESDLYNTAAEILMKENLYHDAVHILEKMPKLADDAGRHALIRQCREMIIRDNYRPDKEKICMLSLCMIVRNEATRITGCLTSARTIVDEIIVVDTGSTDRTKELAKSFGADVYDFPWTGDFSAARNFSLSKASGSWILILDADEVISKTDSFILRNLVHNSPLNIAYELTTRNYINDYYSLGWTANDNLYPGYQAGCGWFASTKVRLFPRIHDVCFEYPVHEIVDRALQRAGFAIKSCAVPIHHYGKLNRDADIVKGEAYYNLGRAKLKQNENDVRFLTELAVQAGGLGKTEEALDLWHRVIRLNPDNAFAHFNIGGLLIKAGRYDESLKASEKARQLNPHSRGTLYNLSIADFFSGNYEKAVSSLEIIIQNSPEYIPAQVLQAAALYLGGEQEKAITYLTVLQERGIAYDNFLHDMAERMISVGNKESASLLLEMSSECNQL